MGIPKLTSLMAQNYKWQSVNVKGHKLVIDGNALCYHLYFDYHEWQLGGDYREFYETVAKYFQRLHELSIDPYIVIDGIDYHSIKYVTSMERCEKRIKYIAGVQSQCTSILTVPKTVLPLFAKAVFVDVLRCLALKFVIADGEADPDIVSLANHLDCPVFGFDSDFFVFNVEKGYIPISIDGGSIVDLSGKVKCFMYQEFDSQFCLHNRDLRLFFAVYLGNDFQQCLSVPSLGVSSTTSVERILDIIQEIDDVKMKEYFASDLEKIEDVRRFYRVSPSSFEQLSDSESLLKINPHTPVWVLRLYKGGHFTPTSMCLLVSPHKTWNYSVVIEDMRQPSAWNITDTVRSYIIGALFANYKCDILVFEIKRSHLSPKMEKMFDRIKVDLSHKHSEILKVPLAEVPDIHVNVRKKLLLRVFHCKDILKTIDSDAIPDDLKLAVIASRFWLKRSTPDKDLRLLVNSLVCCILSCYGALSVPIKERRSVLDRESRLSFVHTFAQWQCVLHDLIMFNQVLDQPFQYTSPGKLFSASLLLHYYEQDKRIVRQRMNGLAKDMVYVITKDLFPVQAVVTQGQGAAIPIENRFSAFQITHK